MILRAIRGRASRSELDELRAKLGATFEAAAHEQHGLARFHVGARPVPGSAPGGVGPAGNDLEVALVSFWASVEHASGGDAREISPFALARRHLRDVEVTHFEIDGTILRPSDVEPVAIRLATGRFSKPGADAEMLNLLRERAPLIGDEMTEAYVGRRLVGRAVEVTFVSAWSSIPADRPLEAAFWPDIALRYDEFSVLAYSTKGVW